MSTSSNATSILGIIAIILVIVAAAYFLMDEVDDNDLEIDIGLVHEMAGPVFLT
jgi:hypothetical protein